VVLLDEIEKAHPSVLGLLLQLFDEGGLTDADGEVASFRHAVIVMTSNLGARVGAPIGFGDGAGAVLGQIATAVREFFPPELWNRIDRVVPFRPLTAETAARVVDKELAKLLGRRGLRERDVFVYAGRAVRERAVAQAFDPRFGARTVKRWLEDHVATALAEALTTAPPARMTVARLRDDAGAIAVAARAGPRAGDPRRRVSAHRRARAGGGGAGAAGRGDGPPHRRRAGRRPVGRALAAVRGAPHADEVRYFIERYGDELVELRAALAGQRRLPAATEGYELHDLEGWRPERRSVAGWSGPRPGPAFDRRSLDRRTRAASPQPVLLAALARAALLLAHTDELTDPEAHAVTVLVTPVGETRPGLGWGLLEALRGIADQAMARGVDGRLRELVAPAVGDVTRGFVVREVFARAAYRPSTAPTSSARWSTRPRSIGSRSAPARPSSPRCSPSTSRG
jgi:hypothetical protein